jgi:GINS complex subunit 2
VYVLIVCGYCEWFVILVFIAHQGVFGPFRVSVPAVVPIWLAIMLRQQKKCTIQPPSWMSVKYLQQKLNEDQEVNVTQLAHLPSHYMTIGKLLLDK